MYEEEGGILMARKAVDAYQVRSLQLNKLVILIRVHTPHLCIHAVATYPSSYKSVSYATIYRDEYNVMLYLVTSLVQKCGL